MNQTMACLFFLFGVFSSSEAHENWQITLSSGEVLSHVGLIQLSGDSLEIVSSGKYSWISVASVSEMRSISNVDVWGTVKDGAFYTGAIGGAVAVVAIFMNAHSNPILSFDPGKPMTRIFGALLGAAFYGAASALAGGTVAGIIALMEDQDKVYDLSHTSLRGKEYILQTILKEP